MLHYHILNTGTNNRLPTTTNNEFEAGIGITNMKLLLRLYREDIQTQADYPSYKFGHLAYCTNFLFKWQCFN